MIRLAVIVFGLAPALASAQSIVWEPHQADRRIPGDALVGGANHMTHLYVCRTKVGGDLVPGRLEAGICHVTHQKRVRQLDKNYEIARLGKATGGLVWAKQEALKAERIVEAGKASGQPQGICHGQFDQLQQINGRFSAGRCLITLGDGTNELRSFVTLLDLGGAPATAGGQTTKHASGAPGADAKTSPIRWEVRTGDRGMPVDALYTGIGSGILSSLCRVRDQLHTLLGTYSEGSCSIQNAGADHRPAPFEVALVSPGAGELAWVKRRHLRAEQAVAVGRTKGKPFGVCRVKWGRTLHTVPFSGGRCLFDSGDGVDYWPEFEVLADLNAKNAKEDSLWAVVAKVDQKRFWAGVYQRAHIMADHIGGGTSWGLGSLIRATRDAGVLSEEGLRSAYAGPITRDIPKAQFRHYHPDFVRYLERDIPARNAEDESKASPSAKLFHGVYDYSVHPTVRIFYQVDSLMQRRPGCLKRMNERYLALTANRHSSPWKTFNTVLQQGYCEGKTVGEGDTTAGQVALWWMRRRWDGTDQLWRRLITKIVTSYDAAWLKEQPKVRR